ncbi:DNA ligase 3 [Lasioglossum baleicum]|uniref:DNA ligase 3 n=1 Tax=Lasioglossum baleicum TaxID=434251 RepID=UPI003FCEA914
MSDEEKEEEKPFAVERAKTGRAKCKKCKCPIEKDTVRIAKLMSNPFGDGKMKAWHHLTCLFEVFAKQRATTKRIDDPEEDISGWLNLCDEDKQTILQKIEEFEASAPFKTPKAKKNDNSLTKNDNSLKNDDSPKKRKMTPAKDNEKKPKMIKKEDPGSSSEDRSKKDPSAPSRDDSFEEFQKVCEKIARVDAYTEKTAVVRRMFTKGSTGDGFKGNTVLWCRMLLPTAEKRIYNLQNKQLVKLFSRILLQDENEMLDHLAQGDVAETIRLFFEKSVVSNPARSSVLTLQEVDQFLAKLSTLTKEDEQTQHFRSIVSRCTCNDLKMIIRLIKHDLRINTGPKHILQAVHDDAYAAYQTSNDLVNVLKRCLETSRSGGPASSSGSASGKKVAALSLMTPVLPMLAEACKSVEMAMKKCPHGMLSEVKYDGERVQVHKRGKEFRYFSRSLKDVLAHKVSHFKDYIPKAFPDGDDLILDSEVLVIDTKTGQPLPFGTLGIHKKAEFKDANVCLFVFDCIYYNGEVLLHKSMMERRRILKKRMTEIPNRIMLSEVQEVHDPRELAEMIAKVLKMGLEGLVLKDVTGEYEPGKRHWLKVKKDYLLGGAMADAADLVVLGAWYGTGNKGGMMSVFLMGCYDEEHRQWVTVTKVHTGHDDATLAMLQDELDMIKIGKDPNKLPSWLRANKPMVPDFVARDPKKQPVWEITGAEFTNQGVHTADGISIRFPRVTRIRDDKDWSTATKLSELHDLFSKRADSIDVSLLLKGQQKIDAEPESSKGRKKSKTPSPSAKKNHSIKDMLVHKRIKQEPSSVKVKEEPIDADIKEEPIDASIKEEPMDTDDDEQSVDIKIKKERSTGISIKEEQTKMKIKEEQTKMKIKEEQTKMKIKEEPSHSFDAASEEDQKQRPEYYAFVDKDYIEYSAGGTPLNWIDGRKPKGGLPANAKPLYNLSVSELKSKTILGAARVLLASGFKRERHDHVRRLLKTLGAKTLKEREGSIATHVIHSRPEISSSMIHEFGDVPKSARHVTVGWLEASASASAAQNVEEHAVQLAPDYCVCPCKHR